MKSIFALAVTGALALSAPAFAQTAGSPGAAGSTGGLSGSNTPGSEGTTNGGAMKGAPRMNEGRAAAPDQTNTPGDKANLNPGTVKGDTMKQDQAK